MKKIILGTALLIGTGLLHGQSAPEQNRSDRMNHEKAMRSPEEKIQQETLRAEKELGLTAEQKQSWEKLSRERMTSNAPLREKLQGSTTPEERKALRQQMRANQQKFHSAVQEILTPDQKVKLDQMRKERKEHHGKEQHRAKRAGSR